MRILSIETSCDETALAIITTDTKTFTIEAQNVASQIELHKTYGGVFPAMAKREHQKNIVPLCIQTLEEAGLHAKGEIQTEKLKSIEEILIREPELFNYFKEHILPVTKPAIDRICVTVGPGLEPTLWVGINFAKALSHLWDIPLVPVNHMEGHILSVFPKKEEETFTMPELSFPVLALLVSGGHTEIVLMKSIGSYTRIGQTRDDAVGEAFDKVARMLNLPYPGGPQISKYAALHRGKNEHSDISLPRPMLHSGDYDFSFSGIKTAVLYFLEDKDISEDIRESVAREFEDAVTEVLTKKTLSAIEEHNATTLIVGGGVAANIYLRQTLTDKSPIPVLFPRRDLATDNAVMIGIVGAYKEPEPLDSPSFVANGNLRLE